MPGEKNIINYTAADIEKYWKGKLSAAEMHAMEKAAMDDPFLADAMEGYKNTSLADSELDSLKERLNKRVIGTVPILNLKRKRFTWLRAAAAIIIIVGIGLLVQQLVFNDKNKNAIAVLEDKAPKSVPAKEQAIPDSINKDLVIQPGSVANKSEQKASPNENGRVLSNTDTIRKALVSDDAYRKKEVEKVPEANAPIVAEKKDEPVKDNAEVVVVNDKINSAAASKSRAVSSPVSIENNKLNEAALNNKYNYRVVDAQNNPIPFANVMNTRDNVGTYTDIKGNFNLVSSDSVLQVQIRSLGYDTSNYKLVPSTTQTGNLVLKEDVKRETFSQNRKVVSSLSRKDSAEIEEPEVGWGNYNTYIANNIQIPEKVRPKKTRNDVELSFDIDKNGQPTNIKVTKSSQCKECDEEAIRLLKEGPKWKKKGKKKGSVKISLDK